MAAANDVTMVSLSSLNINKDYGDGKSGQLAFSIRGGYPRITAFTERSNDRSVPFDYNTMIIAPFDYLTMGIFINQFIELIAGKPGDVKQIACYNTKFENGQRTNERVLQATLEFGKDAEGIVYMAVIAAGKRKVKFELMPKDTWHKFYVKGELITDPAILSGIYARSYIEQARRLLNHHAILDTSKSKQIPGPTTQPVNNATPAADDDSMGGLF